MQITENGVPVEDLIDAVKRAITAAGISSTEPGRDLRVAAVHLTLNTVATATAGGGIELRVPFLGMKLKLGATATRSATHTVEITLVPPDLAPRHEIREAQIDAALLDAISEIRTVITGAAGGDDPFELQTSTVTLTFAVTHKGTLSLGVEGELGNEITHTLRLDLEPGTRPITT